LTKKDVLYADIFIKLRPMNAFALTDQAPVVPLLGPAMQQSGIPGQGHGNRSPVDQVNPEGILGHGHMLHRGDARLNR